MTRIQFIPRLAAAIALWASTAIIPAEPFLYVSNAGGGGRELVKVDIGTGAATAIGPFNQPGAFALAISPDGGLYTVTQGWPPGSPIPQLASVDLVSGNAIPFGVNLNPEIFMGIAVSPEGTLYGVNAMSGTPDTGSLYRFDPATGVATKLKVTGSCGAIMDLAFHPDGTLYGADPTSLYRINPHTGQATLVTALQGLAAVMGLAIDDDGNFYVTEIVAGAPLWRVDPVTGAATAVPSVSLNYPHGLEFIPTPRSGPISIAFEKSPVTAEHWEGSVDTDFDGLADGILAYDQVPGSRRAAGQTVHFEGDYSIETPFYAFTVRLNVQLNLTNGSIRGNGTVVEGWLDGTQVHMEADLVPGGVAGTMRLLPGSAN